ncbi:predicted protein [Nematostella vectensis]|uniref:Integrase core domain-containing protein n=1 Tax=Nematostella vectensis TaxID=45351 RepID=A7SG36_NEMVE|nr:predicted protein [Nematostella vectensis]|eukprot:XP_001629388.1 predicted protein [Nematostella vectensis]
MAEGRQRSRRIDYKALNNVSSADFNFDFQRKRKYKSGSKVYVVERIISQRITSRNDHWRRSHSFDQALSARRLLRGQKHHDIHFNLRTLKRRLSAYGLTRRKKFDANDVQYIKEVLAREIENGPASRNGYRTMWHILRLRYQIHACVETAGGCPIRVYSDHGTENWIIAGMQCYFRADGSDEFAGTKAHKYVPSTSNQRIECFWSSFRKQYGGWWIDFFNDLHESDVLDLSSEIHREALWFCFADLLEKDLEKMKDYWNTHRIRKSKYAAFAGSPDIMYFLLEEYGQTDCLYQFPHHKLVEMKNRLDNEQQCDPVGEDYFCYVMEKK